jgi:hypothetical protein
MKERMDQLMGLGLGGGGGGGAHEEDVRPMQFEEKRSLSLAINKLPGDKLNRVLQIISERMPLGSQNGDEEIEIDLAKLDSGTLRLIQRYVKSALPKKKVQRAPTTKRSKSSKTQMQMAAQLQEDTISRMQQVQAEMQALESGGVELDDSYLFGGLEAAEPAPVAHSAAAPTAVPIAPSALESMLDDGIGHVSEPSSSSDSDDSDDGDVGGGQDTQSSFAAPNKIEGDLSLDTETKQRSSSFSDSAFANNDAWNTVADRGITPTAEAADAQKGSSDLWNAVQSESQQQKQRDEEKLQQDRDLERKQQEQEEAKRTELESAAKAVEARQTAEREREERQAKRAEEERQAARAAARQKMEDDGPDVDLDEQSLMMNQLEGGLGEGSGTFL